LALATAKREVSESTTARNLVGSYRTGERMVTVQYPEERLPLQPHRVRGGQRSCDSCYTDRR